MPNPLHGMAFLPVMGGPRDGERYPFRPDQGRQTPPNRYQDQIKKDGVRAIYVWSPAHDAMVCRYTEDEGESDVSRTRGPDGGGDLPRGREEAGA